MYHRKNTHSNNNIYDQTQQYTNIIFSRTHTHTHTRTHTHIKSYTQF